MSLDGPTPVTRSNYRQVLRHQLTSIEDAERPRSVSRRIPTSTARIVRSSSASMRSSEGTALRVAPELTDPFGPVEVGRHEDVEELGAKPKPPGPEKLLLRQQVTGTSRIDDVMRLKDGFAGCQVDHQHTREIERNLSDDHQDHRAVRHDTHQVDTDVLESDSVVSSRSDEIENGLKRVPVVPPVGPGTSGS